MAQPYYRQRGYARLPLAHSRLMPVLRAYRCAAYATLGDDAIMMFDKKRISRRCGMTFWQHRTDAVSTAGRLRAADTHLR